MEPFSILCTTCQARLRVRDASAVGQILACPKCGSMVMIHAPDGLNTEHPATTAEKPQQPTAINTPSQTPAPKQTGKEPQKPTNRTPPDRTPPDKTPADRTPDKTPPDKTPADRTPHKTPNSGITSDKPVTTDRPTRTFKFREDFETPIETPDVKTPRKPMTPAPPRQTGAPAAAADAPAASAATIETTVPPDSLNSAVPPRYQQWMLIGGAAVVGIALALLVVGILSSRRAGNGNQQDPVVQSNRPSEQSDDQQGPVENSKTVPERSDAAEEPAPESADASATDTSTPPAEGDTVPAVDDTAIPETPISVPDAVSGDPDAQLPPDMVEPADPDVADPDVADPDVADPDATSPATSSPDDASTATEGTSDPTTPAPDSVASTDATDPPTEDAGGVSQAATKAQLSVTVVAIEFEQIALADFAKFITDFTTVPVTLDVDALLAAGITPESELEFQLRGVTVEQVLNTALEPLGAGYSIAADQIVIAPNAAARAPQSTVTYDITDLAEDEVAAEALAAQITTLIAKSSWDSAGGDGALTITERSLDVQQTLAVQYQIKRFLDRLRTARGLLPRSDLPPDVLEMPPAFVQAAADLNVPMAVTFTEPTSLGEIIDHLQTQTDVRILTDWHSLAALDLQPSRTLSIALPEQPFYKLLDSWLAQLKLDYRMIDAQTLQISSQTSLLAQNEVELYRILNERDVDHAKLIAEIQTRIGPPFFAVEEAKGAVAYDALSNCLLVSLPQPQQRTLAAWLQINRKTDLGNDTGDK